MKESVTSGPRKTLLTTLALVALAAGPARAQTAPATGAPAAGAPVIPPPRRRRRWSRRPPRRRLRCRRRRRPTAVPVPATGSRRRGARTPEGIAHAATEIPAQPTAERLVHANAAEGAVRQGQAGVGLHALRHRPGRLHHDTTRSYNDYIGQSLVARDDTYEGTTGRTQFGMRNTRIGFLLDSPVHRQRDAVGGVPAATSRAISRRFRTSRRARRGRPESPRTPTTTARRPGSATPT